MRAFVGAAAVALAIAASACASHHDDPRVLADDTTHGIYDGDLDRTTAHFDAALKLQVTRASIGQISDQMHKLGAYKGLTSTSSDPDKGRYGFSAAFDKGKMMVEIRLDPTQKIGAYRVIPER